VTVICSTPSEPATDLVYIMSSTPLIASSSGVATVSAITFGLAPGYTVRTTTDGGTTSGYSPIGSSGIEIRPAAKITIDSTAAKIGRSMKNLEKSMVCSFARPSGTRRWEWGARPRARRGWRIASEALADPPRERGGTGRIGGLCTAAGVARRGGSVVTARARLRARASAACSSRLLHRDRLPGRGRVVAHGDGLGRHRHARHEHLLHAVHDHLVLRVEARLHHAQAVDHPAQLHVLAHCGVVRPEHVDVLAVLVGEHGLVVDQLGLELAAALHLHAGEQAGGEHAVGVGQHRAGADGAGGRIDLVVDEVHRALVRKALFV